MTTWIAVFTATVIADWLWAKWTISCQEKLVFPAAVFSAAIILCSGFTMIEFTKDPWLLVPAATGAFVGTWVAVVSET